MSKISGLEWQEMSEATREQVSQKLMRDIEALRGIRARLAVERDEAKRSARLFLIAAIALGVLSVVLAFWIAFHR